MSQNTVIFLVLSGLVLLFAVGAMKRSGERQRAEARQAVEMDAADAGLLVLERADGLLFDARTTARAAAELTPLPFARGGSLTAARDLDDLHEMAALEIPAADGTAFRVDARVEYVDESQNAVQRPTRHKRVTVAVTHPRLRAPVELARVYPMPLR